MIRIFFPGQNVPEWLEKVEIREGGKRGTIKFGNVNLIWRRDNTYHVVSFLPQRPMIKMEGFKMFNVIGQGNGVIWHGTIFDVIQRIIRK